MNWLNKQILKLLFVSVLASGCASNKKNPEIEPNPYPCDSMMQDLPEGEYNYSNKRVYKRNGHCYEAIKDTIEVMIDSVKKEIPCWR